MLAIIESQPAQAAEMLQEAFVIVVDLDARRVGQSAIEVSAALEASTGRWSDAAILFGAAEAHAKVTGMRRDPADEQFLTPLIARARVAGGESFRIAEAEGRSLAYEEMIALARRLLLTSRRR
jgi:hypothetical protein